MTFKAWLAAELRAHRAWLARDTAAWRRQLRQLNRRTSAEYTPGQRALQAKWAAE